jgi:hypothetical protein
VIVDAIILVVSGALIAAGMWLLWSATAEAWKEWK